METNKLIGQSVLRREDEEILNGEAQYVDDLEVDGSLWIAMVRSHVARANIISIDSSRALQSPGVVAVYTGKDFEGEWKIPMFTGWHTPGMQAPDHYPLAINEVRYVGEGVAVILAKSRTEALDAVQLVHVDYEYLTPVVNVEESRDICFNWKLQPHESDVDAAFASADVTVSGRYVQQRLIPSSIEPRGVVAVPGKRGSYTLYTSTQIPHILRLVLALTLGIPEQKLRVVAPSVGGAFGSKLNVYPEEALCLALARRLRKPVRWREMRTENSTATTHGRGGIQTIELAATAEGRILAVRANTLADMGAYLRLLTPAIPVFGAFLFSGVYDIPLYSASVEARFTNLAPTDAYRGAGRPEASYAIERTIDTLAHKLGKDPAEIRRMNYIPPFDNGHHLASTLTYDSGNYEPALDKALELVDYELWRLIQKSARGMKSTKHIGIGISSYVEICGLAPSTFMGTFGAVIGGWESSAVRVHPTGVVEVITGTSPHGQSHETTWAQIVSDKLGVPIENIEVFHSDTAISPHGLDTYGSRSLAVGGTSIALSCDKILAKVKEISGWYGRPMTVTEAAFIAYDAHNLPEGMEPNLYAETSYNPPNFTYPFGTHVCVVEVDEETGEVEILKYVAVDDCGVRVNPMIIEGQIHGGIVQGLAQALLEEAVYDEYGNLLSSSFLEYTLPYATEMPSFVLDHTVTPSPTNPLGVKGTGEAGTIGSAQAAINAIVDALRPFGVDNIQMPATPEKIWRAIHESG